MKNLIKPLEWVLNEWHYEYTANTIFPNITFAISEHGGLYYLYTRANFGEFQQHEICETGFESLEEAQSDCQEYYYGFILSGLTQKAIDILGKHITSQTPNP